MENTSDVYDLDFFVIDDNLELVFKILYYSVSIVSVLGNFLIIIVVIKNKQMHIVTNYFIINLAIVDVIISLFSTPFQVIKNKFLF
jgi:hypothetical protein